MSLRTRHTPKRRQFSAELPCRRPLTQATRGVIEPLERRLLLSAGDLDPTFGTAGQTTITLGAGVTLFAQAVAVQTDGKVVVAGGDSNGEFVVARLNTD